MNHAILGQPLPNQPCKWCVHYGGQAWDASSAWCLKDGGRRCVASPWHGCAFYMLEPGADADWPDTGAPPGWQPVRPPAPHRPAPAPARVLVDA
jgi:hypothetical protein